ncbi:hypothetical protein L798_15639 [Zootermopsis nevadensis]|uniref:Uncharacterized protein n=1 Tax=Zootermopsis nevadensis TaxID=136037 RepID=A0A067QV79_ZOONE|nr:hypothetical protein L798_15639 [Zootermopsis nevadensis]
MQKKTDMVRNMMVPHTQITITNALGIAATQRYHDVKPCLQKKSSGSTGTSSSVTHMHCRSCTHSSTPSRVQS